MVGALLCCYWITECANGNVKTVPILKHVNLVFLPPQTTYKIQPCGAGIIAAIKLRYRNFLLERALNLTDEDVVDIYKVEILTAMKALKRIWGVLSPSIIKNCLHFTGFWLSSIREVLVGEANELNTGQKRI